MKSIDSVIKIVSRCNINCKYCYMYNMGDLSYKIQPKFMSIDTIKSISKKAKSYCISKNAEVFHYIFHGGEPLMINKKYLNFIINTAKEILLPEIKPVFSIQTNATLIDDSWAKFIKENKINVGISLDGDKDTNDENRVDHRGKGTYDNVISGIKILKKHNIPVNILSVINVNSCPKNTYIHLKGLGVDSIDFLIPDNNYILPPKYICDLTYKREITPIADWLIEIFNVWFEERNPIDIRFFKYSILSLLGADVYFDYIGRNDNDVFVIETNGDIEPVDSLKICGNEFTKTGLNIKNNSFFEALKNPLINIYAKSKSDDVLCQQCKSCPIVEICGGGFIPHRYGNNRNFDNPSIYCADLIKIFSHINNKVMDNIDMFNNNAYKYLNVDEIKTKIYINERGFKKRN